MSTLYSVGQMNQLADALEAAEYTPEDVTKLRSQQDALRRFKSVLSGTSDVVVVNHIIDTDVDPFIPDSWTVEEHITSGQLEWDTGNVQLYLSDKQRGSYIKGHELCGELRGKTVLNANVLDYLLANPHLIPEEWKGGCVFFWGTIYRDSDGNLHVRCLDWRGGRWHWSYRWLGRGFDSNRPAAVLAGN